MDMPHMRTWKPNEACAPMAESSFCVKAIHCIYESIRTTNVLGLLNRKIQCCSTLTAPVSFVASSTFCIPSCRLILLYSSHLEGRQMIKIYHIFFLQFYFCGSRSVRENLHSLKMFRYTVAVVKGKEWSPTWQCKTLFITSLGKLWDNAQSHATSCLPRSLHL